MPIPVGNHRLEILRARIQFRPASPRRVIGRDPGVPFADLDPGVVHEWLGVLDPSLESAGRTEWAPPLSLLLEAARSAIAASTNRVTRTVWVGASVWPSLPALAHAGVPIEECLFVRATHGADRVWATDVALRSRAAAAVVADGTGLDLSATRRLQLAAEAGGGVCLLARPPWERRELSAAGTRRLVSFLPSPSTNRRWTVELLRCKGMRPAPHADPVRVLEHDHATGALRLVADVLDRHDHAPPDALSDTLPGARGRVRSA